MSQGETYEDFSGLFPKIWEQGSTYRGFLGSCFRVSVSEVPGNTSPAHPKHMLQGETYEDFSGLFSKVLDPGSDIPRISRVKFLSHVTQVRGNRSPAPVTRDRKAA